MDFAFVEWIGWRDVVLVAAAMIGVYLVLSVMRLFQVAGNRGDGGKKEGKRRFSGWEPYSPRQGPTPHSEPGSPDEDFARELARTRVESELESLRRECTELRAETARLGEELARLKASRNVSPLYNEAMVLAQQGMPANGIAGHCGISIGEAELVAALARGESEFERHEQGEDRDERHTENGIRRHG